MPQQQQQNMLPTAENTRLEASTYREGSDTTVPQEKSKPSVCFDTRFQFSFARQPMSQISCLSGKTVRKTVFQNRTVRHARKFRQHRHNPKRSQLTVVQVFQQTTNMLNVTTTCINSFHRSTTLQDNAIQ